MENRTHSTSSVQACQNCKNDFIIDSEDFSFYEKIKVPPPTFCPECRMIRRMIWRNNRSLYKRICGLCNKTLISMYQDESVPVYCIECFNGDEWDQFEYAMDIDWSRTFFEQLYDIIKKQPRIYQYRLGTVVNSDYGNSVVNSKNAYLCFSVIDCEDIMYSESIDRSRNTIDSFASYDLDQCSENVLSDKNYNSHFIVASHSCIDSYFLYDCTNCQNCCLSSNLRNQQYVFKNKKLTKELYEEAIKDLNLKTYSGFIEAKEFFQEIYKNAIHKYAEITASQNVTGDYILNSKDIFKSFDVSNSCENVKYSFRIIKAKDVVDANYTMTGELIYECSSASNNSYNQVCSLLCFASKNIEYSLFCRNCSDCFGCVGLKNAKYCILNKQYSKDEYIEISSRLRKYMFENPYIDNKNRKYVYGDFYPYEFSLFSYNETVALDYFPITNNTAIDLGFSWKDREKRDYKTTIDSKDLPDNIEGVTESIFDEIIACPNEGNQSYQCTTAFRIVPNELQFYKNKKIPLPRFCPNCRHYQRLVYKNSMHLYNRECMCDKENHEHGGKCEIKFETTYSPDRPEKVYCERCYQLEIY